LNMRWKSSAITLSSGPNPATPALFTSTSSLPCFLSISANVRAISSGFEKSP
jgi:hypothetical protein